MAAHHPLVCHCYRFQEIIRDYQCNTGWNMLQKELRRLGNHFLFLQGTLLGTKLMPLPDKHCSITVLSHLYAPELAQQFLVEHNSQVWYMCLSIRALVSSGEGQPMPTERCRHVGSLKILWSIGPVLQRHSQRGSEDPEALKDVSPEMLLMWDSPLYAVHMFYYHWLIKITISK